MQVEKENLSRSEKKGEKGFWREIRRNEGKREGGELSDKGGDKIVKEGGEGVQNECKR